MVSAALQEPASTTEDIWLRLHLLSHRLVAPHSIVDGRRVRAAHQRGVDQRRAVRGRRLRGDPGAAPGCGTAGDRLRRRQVPADGRLRRALRACGSPTATGCASARTSPTGTTVMHEGFVNFNAGTLGTSMVEGRISAGVVVGKDSDVGGGASIMGTLSGGGKEVISIGERCLLGANAGVGISLGDDCVVEAGCYVTAGTKVTLPDGRVVKALELSGSDHVLFRRNSVSGRDRGRAVEGGPDRAQRRPARQLTSRRPASHRSAHDPPSRRPAGRHRAGVRRRCRLPHVARRVAALADPAGRGVPGPRGGPPGRAGPGAVAVRRPDHRDLGAARDAGPGRHDRARHGVPGVRPPQPRVRRPRLARPVPAAAVTGVGVARRSSSTRTSPSTPSTTPWRRSTATWRCR